MPRKKFLDLIGFLESRTKYRSGSLMRVCLVSPDPGHDLVKVAIEEEIAVVTVPGASAGISALIARWFVSTTTYLYGFLLRENQASKSNFST